MRIVFCMASKESAANLNPLQSNQIRPDLVIVAITQTMQALGDHLIQEIKSTGLTVKALNLQQETSLLQLKQQMEAMLEQYFDHEILVNLTGGNKLMALAAYQVFSEYGFRCFYQDFSSNEIIWLDNETRTSDHISKMSLDRYLKAYQFEVGKKEKLAELSKNHKLYVNEIIKFLCKNFDKNKSFISKLNAHALEKPLSKEELKHVQFTQEEEAFLVHLSYETDIFKLKQHTLEFTSREDRELVAGKWLEVYAADALRQVEQVRDTAIGVNISKSTQRQFSKVAQELDVMAMYQQKLLLIECKTVNWKTATEASGAIYKLSALGNIGGLNTQACFVSLYDLPAAAKTRAAENGIHIVCGKNILQLVQHMNQWLHS